MSDRAPRSACYGRIQNGTVGNVTVGHVTVGNDTVGNVTVGNEPVGNDTVGNETVGNVDGISATIAGGIVGSVAGVSVTSGGVTGVGSNGSSGNVTAVVVAVAGSEGRVVDDACGVAVVAGTVGAVEVGGTIGATDVEGPVVLVPNRVGRGSPPEMVICGPLVVTASADGAGVLRGVSRGPPSTSCSVASARAAVSSTTPPPNVPAEAPTNVAATSAALPPAALEKTDVGNSVAWASHDTGPVARRRRGTEMLRNARTTVGSKWVPADRASSARACADEIGCLYERADVITSKASATATIRAESAMSVPPRPAG